MAVTNPIDIERAWESHSPELVCPLDHLPLTQSHDRLQCADGHRWTIREGIPRMVSEEASYTDAFGLQWNTFTRTQLDSYTGCPITYERVRRCLGDACWRVLLEPPQSHVLEAGCGAGRFTEILLGATHAHVTSIDYSAAVEANQTNFPLNERHQIAQADIRSLPFSPGSFDFVVCLGVIQHTPNPEETVARLYERVRPGGWLIIDHYTDDHISRMGRVTRLSRLVRPVMKRLPMRTSLRWNERLVNAFFPLHRATCNSRTLRWLVSRVSPVLSYYHIHPELDDRLQYEWALLDTYDSLTDYYKHKRSKGEIEVQLRALGATDIHCEYGGNGIEARCRRPEPSA